MLYKYGIQYLMLAETLKYMTVFAFYSYSIFFTLATDLIIEELLPPLWI